ncbi:MAG: helix-turn-helix domain-containing protein [Vicinamibacteria bacterium]
MSLSEPATDSLGDPHLTVEDVARWLAVPVSWVYTHAEDGSLPSYRIGRYRRFRAEELAAWAAKQREGAA